MFTKASWYTSTTFIVSFIRGYPKHQTRFPTASKMISDGKALPVDESTVKIFNLVLDVVESVGNPAKLTAYAKQLRAMPQHKGLCADDFNVSIV